MDLLDDFGCREIGNFSQGARGTKGAGHLAADLRTHAHSGPSGSVLDDYSFNQMIVLQLNNQFPTMFGLLFVNDMRSGLDE